MRLIKKISSAETLDIDKTKNVEALKFSDPEVQKYVGNYGVYVDEYLAAAKAKDIAKLGQLAQEWNVKEKPAIQKLVSNSDELRKYNDYILKLANKMTVVMIKP